MVPIAPTSSCERSLVFCSLDGSGTNKGDANCDICTVRYEAVNAMLLNEFLKARRQIDAQQKQIDALTAGLQKVSAQLEARKPAPQLVNNP
jgi:hypothetical protein